MNQSNRLMLVLRMTSLSKQQLEAQRNPPKANTQTAFSFPSRLGNVLIDSNLPFDAKNVTKRKSAFNLRKTKQVEGTPDAERD